MLRFDFVGRAQQKALPVGASNVEPRKESMSSLRISGQGRGSMRKALRLQPWVAWPAMADDLTAGLDFGLEKSVQAAGRCVGDYCQSRQPRNRFLAWLAGSAPFHRDRHHRLGFAASSLLGLTLFRSTP